MLIPKRITTGYGAVVTITGKLAHWDNVLTTWVTEMERLSDAFVFPIYDLFRERANFSILAQAANRTPDYAAVPETKDFNGKKGFYDFLLQHPRGIDVAEGKFGWFNMPALGKVGGGEVGDALTEADLEMKDRIRVGHCIQSGCRKLCRRCIRLCRVHRPRHREGTAMPDRGHSRPVPLSGL